MSVEEATATTSGANEMRKKLMDEENQRYAEFHASISVQYWQNRCLELAAECQSLKQTLEVCQNRLQLFEDSVKDREKETKTRTK